MAKSFADEQAYSQMIVLAKGYEQMARMAEEMKLIIRKGASPFISRPSANQLHNKPRPTNGSACLGIEDSAA
jgi:hypothetical protein